MPAHTSIGRDAEREAVGAPSTALPPQPRCVVRPIRIRVWDDRVRAETVRVVGYRYVCSCGDRGGSCPEYDEARAEKAAHVATHASA